MDLFARAKIDGTRRMGRILVDDLAIDEAGTVDAPALDVSFSLPKGAFATTVMRELMKVDLADIPEEDE